MPINDMSSNISFQVHSMVLQGKLRSYNKSLTTSMERLATGSRINVAKDNPHKNYEAKNLESEISSKERAKRNASDGAALMQIAEGACNEVQNILHRVREIAVQAANDTLTSTERHYMNEEAGQLLFEVDRITSSTTYNKKTIFGAKGDSFSDETRALVDTTDASKSWKPFSQERTESSFQKLESMPSFKKLEIVKEKQEIKKEGEKEGWTDAELKERLDELDFYYANDYDPNKDDGIVKKPLIKEARAGILHINSGATNVDEVKISIPEITTKGLGLETLSVASQNGATKAIDDLDAAMSALGSVRSYMGVLVTSMDKQVDDLGNINVGLNEYLGKIKDTDFARESTDMVSAQIQQQAATSILTQSNSRVSRVLEMLAR